MNIIKGLFFGIIIGYFITTSTSMGEETQTYCEKTALING